MLGGRVYSVVANLDQHCYDVVEKPKRTLQGFRTDSPQSARESRKGSIHEKTTGYPPQREIWVNFPRRVAPRHLARIELPHGGNSANGSRRDDGVSLLACYSD